MPDFDFEKWMEDLRGLTSGEDFIAILDQTFCDLHDAPHQKKSRELSCKTLIDQVISGDFFNNSQTPNFFPDVQYILGLQKAAQAADGLQHSYHRGPHIREVTLSVIAQIIWLESKPSITLDNQFKYNAVMTALIHDLDHPGQDQSENVKTEAYALAAAIKNFLIYLNPQKNIEPIIMAGCATAQPPFPDSIELQKRYDDNKGIIHGKFPLRHVQPEAIEHMPLARLVGASDLLPSLVSPQRLAIGALKFLIESKTANIDASKVIMVADNFLKSVEESEHPFKVYGIPIDFDGLRDGIKTAPIKKILADRIAAPAAKAAPGAASGECGPNT